MIKVFMASPSYDGRIYQGTMFAFLQVSKNPNVHCEIVTGDCSSLTRNFNTLWVDALNRLKKEGFTHFAMMHDDIVPEKFWLDKLLNIMEAKGADVVSCIVPQKSSKGLTSTGFDQGGWNIRRLTMKEAFKDWEPTFTHPDLVVNTGLMLVDMRKPWVEDIVFRFEDGVVKDPDGVRHVVQITEDFCFSRDARKAGAVLYATREVVIAHMGKNTFPNTQPWGTLERDPGHK